MKNLLLIVLLIPLLTMLACRREWQDFTETLPRGVKLEMVVIPGGSFMMGSEGNETEQPLHKVTLKPFYIGKYEVTQAQWEAMMGNNPSRFKDNDLPVESMSWNDAKEFCKKLSEITGKEYRLPSEAEWEYATRAGSTGDYCFEGYTSMLDEYAWFADVKAHPVGQKKPNAWGLYDVHGNVSEWCEDVWHASYESAPTDGSAWIGGGDPNYRMVRGGLYLNLPWNCRSASRSNFPPNSPIGIQGFRVAYSGGNN